MRSDEERREGPLPRPLGDRTRVLAEAGALLREMARKSAALSYDDGDVRYVLGLVICLS